MLIDLESVRALPDRERSWLPPLALRMHQPVGASVRLLATRDGAEPYLPWVQITAITDTGYIGNGCDVDAEIAFTADNIIEI